jgi:hypothetical protein
MLKLGITTEKALSSPKTFLGRKKKVSLSLIMRLYEEGLNNEKSEFYFNELRIGLPYKRTHSGRFSEINNFIIDVIKSHLGVEKIISVHDMAASSGITSWEFFEQLEAEKLKVAFIASDYYTHLFFVRLHNHRWLTVLDSDFNILQYIGYGFVLTNPEANVYILNNLLLKYLNFSVLPKAQNFLYKVIKNKYEYDRFGYKEESGSIQRIPLISPEILKHLDVKNNFKFIRHDLFRECKQKVDIIRTMNILNKTHFSEKQLLKGGKSIINSLNDKGLWIVGENRDNKGDYCEATLYAKSGNRLIHLGDFCGGSEISDLIKGKFEVD